MKLEKIMEVIEYVYSDEHTLVVNTCGICGIEDYSGVVDRDFESLEDLYKWVSRYELKKKKL